MFNQILYIQNYKSKLLQVSYSALDAWVGAEEFAHHVCELALEGDGLHDEELGHVFAVS